MLKKIIQILTITSICFASSAFAEDLYVEKDLQVVARTFSFVDGLPKDQIVVGILYDDSVAQSKADKDNLLSLMGSGLKTGNLTLIPKPVSIHSLSEASDVNVICITSGMNGSFDAIYEFTKNKKMLSFAKNSSCMDQQKCVMVARADPDVVIYLGKKATGESNVSFAQALKLMVKEQN